MNNKIKSVDVKKYPDMKKFHQTLAEEPQKAAELIFRKFSDYFKRDELEIDLRNEEGW